MSKHLDICRVMFEDLRTTTLGCRRLFSVERMVLQVCGYGIEEAKKALSEQNKL